MNKISNKLSYFAVAFIMAAIIISFVLTGFQGFGTNPDQVAVVGDTPITVNEFNQAYNMQMNRYAQMFGGKSLTNQQIKMLRLKEQTLQGLISQKLLQNFGNKLGFDAGKGYIKDAISKYPAFQSNGKFDVSKYKNLLRANSLSPTKFESDIINQVKSEKLRKTLTSLQESRTAAQALAKLKSIKAKTHVISFIKQDNSKYLTVPQEKINELVKNNENLLQSLYKTYTAKQKNNSEKDKKPQVKSFDQMKETLAKEHVQRTMDEELKQFNQNLVTKIHTAMEKGKKSTLNKLIKEFSLSETKEHELSPFQTKFKNIDLSEYGLIEALKNQQKGKVIKAETPTQSLFVAFYNYDKKKQIVSDKELEQEIESSKMRIAGNVERAIIQHEQETTKVVTNLQL